MSLLSLHRSQDAPLDPDSSETLVSRSRDGDLEAYNRLMSRYYGVTYGLAYRILLNREAAEDAAQEIFLKAWRSLRGFRGAAKFSTWLRAIAVRHCMDAARKRRDEGLRLSDWTEDEIPAASGFRMSDPDLDRYLALREAVGRLNEKLRVVVALHFYGDASVAEIAKALDLPLRTVYSRLEIALRRLERDLSEEEGE
jgi:RNA polymerase sigma-70 factor (ECF subfamily)